VVELKKSVQINVDSGNEERYPAKEKFGMSFGDLRLVRRPSS
jgi:hypothetical protein